MDKQTWLDAIPFYLNGTLNAQQTRQFEQMLQQNPDLQTELDAWRAIADVVYTGAKQRTRKLPPIAPRVRQSITNGNQTATPANNHRPNQATLIPMPPEAAEHPVPRRTPKPPKSQRNTPDTTTQISVVSAFVALAAAVGVLMVAGIIYYAASTLDAPANPVAVAPTDTPTPISRNTATTRPTQQPPTATSPPTRPPSTAVPPPTGIVAVPTQLPAPSAEAGTGGAGAGPQTTPFSLPTPVPGNDSNLTPRTGIGGGAADSQMADPLPTPNASANAPQASIMSQSVPVDCVVTPNANRDVYVYAQPSTDSAVIWLLAADQTLPARTQTTTTGTAFYGVDLPESQLDRGWILISQVTLNTPDDAPCSSLPTPTPTS